MITTCTKKTEKLINDFVERVTLLNRKLIDLYYDKPKNKQLNFLNTYGNFFVRSFYPLISREFDIGTDESHGFFPSSTFYKLIGNTSCRGEINSKACVIFMEFDEYVVYFTIRYFGWSKVSFDPEMYLFDFLGLNDKEAYYLIQKCIFKML